MHQPSSTQRSTERNSVTARPCTSGSNPHTYEYFALLTASSSAGGFPAGGDEDEDIVWVERHLHPVQFGPRWLMRLRNLLASAGRTSLLDEPALLLSCSCAILHQALPSPARLSHASSPVSSPAPSRHPGSTRVKEERTREASQ